MSESFFQSFILLLLVTDPFGNVPLFVSTLRQVAPERRNRVVLRECMIAFGLLLVFMMVGRPFLDALQLSEVALRIGGGVVLFLIALRMVFPQPGGVFGQTHAGATEPLIVPLAIPALAGPSALVTVLLFSSQAKMSMWLYAAVISLVAVVWLTPIRRSALFPSALIASPGHLEMTLPRSVRAVRLWLERWPPAVAMQFLAVADLQSPPPPWMSGWMSVWKPHPTLTRS